MALKKRTKIYLAAIVVAPLFFAVVCVLAILRSADQKTQALLNHVAKFEQHGLTPEVFPQSWLADLLAVEDPGFYGHNGVDLSTPGAGFTTITQGLVKIYHFDDFKPGIAKLKQTILAIELDSELSKRQQLVLFLNAARLGSIDGKNVSGFPNAAVAYFGKSVESLTRHEFLSLVAMLVGPNHYNLASNPEENRERVRRILAMLSGQCSPQGLSDVYYESCEAARVSALVDQTKVVSLRQRSSSRCMPASCANRRASVISVEETRRLTSAYCSGRLVTWC